jgi:hypothetical protein
MQIIGISEMRIIKKLTKMTIKKIAVDLDKASNLFNINLVQFSESGEYLGFVQVLQKHFGTFAGAEKWAYQYSKEMDIPLDKVSFNHYSF